MAAASRPAAPEEGGISINGMVCPACPASVKAAVSRLPGVSQVEVSLDRAEAVVRYDPDRIAPADIVAAINRLGFQARLLPGAP